MADDKDKIVRYDYKTDSYVNGRGEALKFTPKSMSIYSNTPDKPHSAAHINVDHEKGTFTLTTHDEGEKSTSQTGKCYLTTACMEHQQEKFDDNCMELTILRWFRDNFVSQEDIEHYYEVAPLIVDKLNSLETSSDIYKWIYDNVIVPCIIFIRNGQMSDAYSVYKNTIEELEKEYIQTNNKVKKLKRV